MAKLKFLISLFCLSVFLNAHAQISLSALKSQGINSKEDLKKLGLSEAEIKTLESQYMNKAKQSKSTGNSSGEISEPINPQPVKNEVPVSAPTTEVESTPFTVFGQNIFQSGSFELEENSDRIIPHSSYVLGSGDRVSITIWGASEFNDEFTLDAFGNITPKLVGRISLKGMTFDKAKKVIASRFGKVYNLSSSRIAVHLSYSKVISVNVVGEVKKPGTYSIPSINSAFNVLSFSGGITSKGSIRSIEIRRHGKIISTLDVYEFLNNPQKFSHTSLNDGDFIVVNALNETVDIEGELVRNGKFELKLGETLSEFIEHAGGLTAQADPESIGLTTIENAKFVYKSISLNASKDLKLKAGDIIEVLRISDVVYGVIEVQGEVNLPGKFEFKKGEKVLDLLKRAKGPTRLSYDNVIHVVRTNPEDLSKSIISLNLGEVYKNGASNIELQELDLLKVYNKSDLYVADSITVYGKVLSTGKLACYNNLTLNDVVIMSRGLKKEADSENIQVERVSFNKNDSSKSYIELIKLSLTVNGDFELKPYDKIHFRALPEFKFQSSIVIKGEVRYPGNYTLDGRDEKLSSLIQRAGGVSEWAFLDGAKLYRKEDSLGVLLMNLKEVLAKKDSKFDYVLKPGDVILVPKTNNIVTISGAIGFKLVNKNESIVNSPFHGGKRAGFYIKRYAGGYDYKAKKNNVYVISSNGTVKETKFLGLRKPKIGSGDKIVVNYKREKRKKAKSEPVNWNSVIENTTIKITGILTLLILANTAVGN